LKFETVGFTARPAAGYARQKIRENLS